MIKTEFPDSFNFFCLSTNEVGQILYKGIFSHKNISINFLDSYRNVETYQAKKSIPIVVDLIFSQYCPECKELMPPGKPPMTCRCGAKVRIGYIPLYELPKTFKGYVVAPPELPKETISALRRKGWTVKKYNSKSSVFDIVSFIEDMIGEQKNNEEKDIIRKDSK